MQQYIGLLLPFSTKCIRQAPQHSPRAAGTDPASQHVAHTCFYIALDNPMITTPDGHGNTFLWL